MSFYSDKVVIVTDSLSNIYTFQWSEGSIVSYFFNSYNGSIEKSKIAGETLEEYDVAIGNDDTIYLVYQNKDKHLYLAIIFKEDIEIVRLTESPNPYVYDINILIDNEQIHILYNILIDENTYRIYHHHYDENDWITSIVAETKVLKILNPFSMVFNQNEIFVIYYNLLNETEEIFMKTYDFCEKKWSSEIKITNDLESKIYLDTLLQDNFLHLVCSQYFQGNLVVKYQKYDMTGSNVLVVREVVLSNAENCSHPTIIQFEDKLWVVWLEYDNVLSRYSIDNGETWSPIYLWRESKDSDFLRYKYCEYPKKESDKKLNYSFGKVYPNISFIGFGPLENVLEIPLKKKQKKIPRI